jgi:hypothetical protein
MQNLFHSLVTDLRKFGSIMIKIFICRIFFFLIFAESLKTAVPYAVFSFFFHDFFCREIFRKGILFSVDR